MNGTPTTEPLPQITRKRPATYEDYLAVPEPLRAEVLDGELIIMPHPRGRHLKFSSILGGMLGNPFELGLGGPGGFWIIDGPELHLGKDVVVPDLAGWLKQDMPEVRAVPFDAFELDLSVLWIKPRPSQP